MVISRMGATRALPRTKEQWIRSLMSTSLRYATAPYPTRDPSEKMCSSVFLISPKLRGLKHRCTFTSFNFAKSLIQRVHCFLSNSSIASSHFNFFRHNSWRRSLAFMIYGAIIPNGSKREDTTDKIPRRVAAFPCI